MENITTLWIASAFGYLSIVKLLVQYGADVNSMTRTNSTPVCVACYQDHYEIVEFLVMNGADIEIANL